MTFNVLFRPRAARSIRKLQRSVGLRILETVKRLEQSPEIGDQLIPSRFWKIRIGDYRVIYEVDRASKQVTILFVGHRKNVYDEFSRLM